MCMVRCEICVTQIQPQQLASPVNHAVVPLTRSLALLADWNRDEAALVILLFKFQASVQFSTNYIYMTTSQDEADDDVPASPCLYAEYPEFSLSLGFVVHNCLHSRASMSWQVQQSTEKVSLART